MMMMMMMMMMYFFSLHFSYQDHVFNKLAKVISEPAVTTEKIKIGRFDEIEDSIIINRIGVFSGVADEEQGKKSTDDVDRNQQPVKFRWTGTKIVKYNDEENENIRYLLGGHSELNEEIWDDVAEELNLNKKSLKRRWNKLQREKELKFFQEEIWDDLAKELNRDKLLVKLRWKKLQEQTKERKNTEKKEGKFDDDEDSIIRSRIEGHQSDVVDEAIWNELAKDLTRERVLVRRRWDRMKKKQIRNRNIDAYINRQYNR